MPDDSPAWPLATSTRDNCLGGKCRHFSDCFVMKARREALAADVVVVNHHLFFADVVLRDEGMAELLPSCNTVILDEAHQLPETATAFFGETVSTAPAARALPRRARRRRCRGARRRASCRSSRGRADKAARDLRLARRGEGTARPRRARCRRPPAFADALEALREALAAARARRSRRSRSAAKASRPVRARATELAVASSTAGRDGDAATTACAGSRRYTHALRAARRRRSPSPSRSAASSRNRRAPGSSPRRRWRWAATSATTARARARATPTPRSWESPFDYRRQALLYLPRGLPRAERPGAHRRSGRRRAAGARGERRARVPPLHDAARDAARARRLETALRERACAVPLLVQGDGLAQRAARALPRARQRGAARQPVVLGRRRRARRGAVGGGDRQAAVRPARRPGARGAPRAHLRARAATRSSTASCRRR